MLIERQRNGKPNRDNWATGEDVMRWWMYGDGDGDANQQILWETGGQNE